MMFGDAARAAARERKRTLAGLTCRRNSIRIRGRAVNFFSKSKSFKMNRMMMAHLPVFDFGWREGAANRFAAIRRPCAETFDMIPAGAVPDVGPGKAIMGRLLRAGHRRERRIDKENQDWRRGRLFG